MIDFDAQIKSQVEKENGFYRRYSDDIFVALPAHKTFKEIEALIAGALRKYFLEKLKINADKTDWMAYRKDDAGMGTCYNKSGKRSAIQYLGFTFDGKRSHIRSSSISRNRSKISRLITKNIKGKNLQTGRNNINTRKLYKAQSPRKITLSNRYEEKGFISYGIRAQEIQGASEIGRQIRKNDRFLQKKIEEKRT